MQEIDDKGYRKLFSNKEIFRQLMASFVHEAWVKELDFSRCELVKGSFVSRKYKKTFTDLLYKVKLRGRDLYVVILLEFKSAPALFVAVQMAGYIFEFCAAIILTMLSWLEQKQRQKNERQKNEVWYHQSNAHLEQRAPHRVARRLRQSGVNIFLPSIFLSFECFCGMLLPCRSKQSFKNQEIASAKSASQ